MNKPILFSELMYSPINEFIEAVHIYGLKCYASDFVSDFDLEAHHLEVAVERAILACQALNIPSYFHFRKIYRVDDGGVYSDWKLSPYGCYLTLINADPSNIMIARFQSSLIIGD